MSKYIETLHEEIETLHEVLNTEIDRKIATGDYDSLESTPADMSARYWLMQFLEPLSRKELKSVVDGFLVQLLNDEQAKKLVKFLLVRFPGYYNEGTAEGEGEGDECPGKDDGSIDVSKAIKFQNRG